MNDLKFSALITIPKLMTVAKYRISFKFFGNNLKTSGDYFSTYDNSKIILPLKLKRVIINGVEVMRLEPILVQFAPGTVTQLKITNLFGGNKAIEEIIHAIIINNQDITSGNVRPVIEANLSRIFTDIANKILESTTFDEMFPV